MTHRGSSHLQGIQRFMIQSGFSGWCKISRHTSVSHHEARVSAQGLIEVEPDFTVGGYISRRTIHPERLAMVAEALRRAGLPED
jgi:hypothetical protein